MILFIYCLNGFKFYNQGLVEDFERTMVSRIHRGRNSLYRNGSPFCYDQCILCEFVTCTVPLFNTTPQKNVQNQSVVFCDFDLSTLDRRRGPNRCLVHWESVQRVQETRVVGVDILFPTFTKEWTTIESDRNYDGGRCFTFSLRTFVNPSNMRKNK